MRRLSYKIQSEQCPDGIRLGVKICRLVKDTATMVRKALLPAQTEDFSELASRLRPRTRF